MIRRGVDSVSTEYQTAKIGRGMDGGATLNAVLTAGLQVVVWRCRISGTPVRRLKTDDAFDLTVFPSRVA